jgi:serine/threonine protein kinase
MIRCENCFCEYDDNFDICPQCGHVKGSAAEEAYQLTPGILLSNRYIVGLVLGFGGFGITYKAWDTKLETVVAIKEYYPGGLVNRIPGTKVVILFTGKRKNDYDYGRVRFLDEAKNMAKFNSHKNIVNVIEYFEENNTAYIVMEYLEGIALNKYLHQNGDKLDVNTSVTIALNICSALKAIHNAGIIHRDISPDNIFICTNNVIKLIDFGAARFSLNEDKKMTIILKPGFAPPEQYENINEQGPWTDIYALGASLYLMITGTKPEESTNRRICDTLVPPNKLDPSIPININNTIMKAMALDKFIRFSNIDDLIKALQGEKKVITLANEKKKKKRRKFLSLIAAALILMIGLSLVVHSYSEKKSAEILNVANITVWLSIADNSSELKAVESVKDNFERTFPGVKINITSIPKSEYKQKIEEAAKNGTLPTLFESTEIENGILEKATDIKDILSTEQANNCYFLSQYSEYYKKRQINDRIMTEL